MESEKISVGEPMVEKNETEEVSCCKKNLKIIIFICCGIIVIGVVVVLLILLLKKDSSDSKYNFGLSMEELEKRTNEKYLGTKVLLKADSTEFANLQESWGYSRKN